MGAINNAQALKMWKDTNYSAQIEEMEKAGINPALIYGGGGGGGQTAKGSPGSVSSSSAPVGGGEMQAMAMMGLQAQMMEAQKKNIEADTQKKQMETDVMGGVGVQKTLQETSNIAQDTLNKVAQEELTKAQTKIANIQGEVNEATKREKVDKIKAESIGAVLHNALTKIQTQKTGSDIQVNEANINKMAQDIAQGWRRLTLDQFKAEIEANFKGINQILGNQVQQLFKAVDDIMGVKTDEKPIKVDK